jgi:Putative cyclase
MPMQSTRRFEVFTKRTGEYLGSNRRGSNEELVVSEIGQVGTQFDGFAHQTHEDRLYNCFKLDEIATRTGFKKLGVQNVGALITRGVMIDVAGFKGVDMLEGGYEITVADLEGALKKQNLALQPGDAVIINTGWGKLWNKDNAPLYQVASRHRREGGRVDHRQGPDADGRRQHVGRGFAQSRSESLRPDPPDGAGHLRRASAGAPQARRTVGEGRHRVRLHDAATEAARRHRLDRRADRGAVTDSGSIC